MRDLSLLPIATESTFAVTVDFSLHVVNFAVFARELRAVGNIPHNYNGSTCTQVGTHM